MTCLQNANNFSCKRQHARLQAVLNLIQQRRDIEKKMLVIASEVDHTFDAARQGLIASLSNRVKELEAPREVRATERRASNSI